MKYVHDKKQVVAPLSVLFLIWLTVVISMYLFADWLIMQAYEIGLFI